MHRIGLLECTVLLLLVSWLVSWFGYDCRELTVTIQDQNTRDAKKE